MTVTVVPLAVPGPLGPGLDLVATLLAARTATPGTVRAPAGTPARRHPGTPTDLRDGDVVLVASKVVALAEGRLVELPAAAPGRDPRRVLARRHARRIVVDDPRILVVETDHGLVCANAGIDTSNVPDGQALLLPTDPDGSAFRLRQALRDAIGVDVGVVVTDTFGRPWREGQVDVAIGSAGITPLRDERGSTDLHGRHLEVTVAAVADELAGVADLVRDKATPVPFVVVRGLDLAGPGVAADLVRPAHLDLFPAGGPTLADHALALGAIPAPDRPTRIDPDVDPLGAVRAVAVDDVARTAGVVVVAAFLSSCSRLLLRQLRIKRIAQTVA